MTTAAQTAKTFRPIIPAILGDFAGEMFAASHDLERFVEKTLLCPDSVLYNPDHEHLIGAAIGYLWTNVPNTRQQKPIAATAEMPKPPQAGNAWAKAKWRCQMQEWFGAAAEDLDFLITIDANYAAECSDLHFVALLDHELYHCVQKEDEFGAPKFTKEGSPVYTLKGHDAEEFVGIVRRYGAGAGAGDTAALVEAGRQEPEIAEVDVRAVCGSCG